MGTSQVITGIPYIYCAKFRSTQVSPKHITFASTYSPSLLKDTCHRKTVTPSSCRRIQKVSTFDNANLEKRMQMFKGTNGTSDRGRFARIVSIGVGLVRLRLYVLLPPPPPLRHPHQIER